MFLKFKLKVFAALDAGLDTLPSFKKELKGYRDQLAQGSEGRSARLVGECGPEGAELGRAGRSLPPSRRASHSDQEEAARHLRQCDGLVRRHDALAVRRRSLPSPSVANQPANGQTH